MKKKWLIYLAIFACLLLAAGLLLWWLLPRGVEPEDDTEAEEETTVLIRIGHDAPPDHSLQQALLSLRQTLEQQSGGRIQIELYPYYVAGEDSELIQFTAEGALQMCLPLSSSLAALPPEDDATFTLDIPESWRQWGAMDGFYLFADADAAQAALEGETGAAMTATLADLPGQPLLFLGWAYEGPINLASSSQVIRQPADLRGQKVAVIGSAAWFAAYRSLGASAQAMLLSAIYPALMKKQASVCQVTPEYMLGLYIDDYATSMTLTEHAFAYRPVLVNRQWYEGLEPEDAALITAALANFLLERRQMAETAYAASISQLQQRGLQVIELSEAERALWQEAGK